ncbi:MAG: flagellar assembly protein A [Pseudomonadota bacterium]
MPHPPLPPSHAITSTRSKAGSGGIAQGNPPTEKAEKNTPPEIEEIIGNLSDLKEGEILLPGFVIRKPEGLCVDLVLLEKQPKAFAEFVERTFAANAYFPKSDFRVFQMLLFDPEKTAKLRANLEAARQIPAIRFAETVARFPEARKSLYRALKITPRYTEASYFFEPLVLDKTLTSVAEDGTLVPQTLSEPAHLNFDEFLAHLWNSGVRYGIPEVEIRTHMAEEAPKIGWVTIARQLDPVSGKDAQIHEEFDKLHRDRSPAILASGKVDLSYFKNTFPQVGKGIRLIRKIPRVMGSPGRNIAGFPLEPPQPKDIDLGRLAGAGIQLERGVAGEFLVSVMAGFLNIDTKTHQFFITERLISREGISVRTTGSLDIEAEEFEEYGNVEKGFSLTGHSLHIKGSVFGTVISKGGILKIGGNVSNGEVRNAGGLIEIDGFAANACLESRNGEVRLKRAENTVIRAKKAVLQEIRNCTVVADTIEIIRLQNSVVAGKSVSVGSAGLKPGLSERDENVFVLEIPDLAELAKNLEGEALAIAEVERFLTLKRADVEKKRIRYDALTEIPSVKGYLENSRKVKALQEKGRTLTPEQLKAFAYQRSKITAELTEMAEISKALKTLAAEIGPLEKTLEERKTKKADYEAKVDELSEGVSIRIQSVTGETVVRKRKIASKTVWLRDIPDIAELRKELDSLGSGHDRVFHASSGSVNWKFEPPK